ncbi:MAG: SpoIVB peptidase S55 domain-containing protein [Actinomycetota bacterium]
MTGTGLTAISGSSPTNFDIQVIGTLPDAILPGFDLVIFKITGPPAFLDQAHGVAAGMSGSPIFIGGQLAGAVSYRFFFSDATIGLFTPAQKMVDLLDYVGGTAAVAMPDSVAVTAQARRAVAEAAGVTVDQVPASAQKLVIPLAVSGLSDRRAEELQTVIDDHGLPFHVYRAGSSAQATAVDPTSLSPGEPFAAVLSTGDTTFAGIGTTTFACGDLNVAWGHDFFFQGPSAFGMNSADVVTVLDDPSCILGPFKILVLAEAHGTVIQDRLAGLVGQAGTGPAAAPVTTVFTNTDTGRSRTGQTDMIYQEDFWGPEIAFSHVYQNLLLVFDQFGDGTLRMSWTIRGLREDGVTPFTVRNTNMYYSRYSAIDGSYRLLSSLYQLAFNRFEDITFTGVDSSGEITERELVGDIARVRTASSLQRGLRERFELKAKPGSTITIEVSLEPAEGGHPIVTTVKMRVPWRARGDERVTLRGGRARRFFDRRGLGSFKEVLAELNGGDHPNDLIVTGLGRRISKMLDLVVDGRASFIVHVVR